MELRQETLNASTAAEVQQKSAGLQAFERHYTVAQLSKLWFFSVKARFDVSSSESPALSRSLTSRRKCEEVTPLCEFQSGSHSVSIDACKAFLER